MKTTGIFINGIILKIPKMPTEFRGCARIDDGIV